MKTTTCPKPGLKVASGPFKGLFYLPSAGIYHRLGKLGGQKGEPEVFIAKSLNLTFNFEVPEEPLKIGDLVDNSNAPHAMGGHRIGKIISFPSDTVALLEWQDEAAERSSDTARFYLVPIKNLKNRNKDCNCD